MLNSCLDTFVSIPAMSGPNELTHAIEDPPGGRRNVMTTRDDSIVGGHLMEFEEGIGGPQNTSLQNENVLSTSSGGNELHTATDDWPEIINGNATTDDSPEIINFNDIPHSTGQHPIFGVSDIALPSVIDSQITRLHNVNPLSASDSVEEQGIEDFSVEQDLQALVEQNNSHLIIENEYLRQEIERMQNNPTIQLFRLVEQNNPTIENELLHLEGERQFNQIR